MIVVDLENTISNANHRLWMLTYKNNEEMYKKFQDAFEEDRLNNDVKLFLDSLSKKGYTIVILTAKTYDYFDIVIDWLERYDICYDALVMKPSGDYKFSDLEFKKRYIKNNIDEIEFALNDVGKECALFSNFNIPCLRIVQK